MIDITEVGHHITTDVIVRFQGAEQVKASYLDRHILPDYMKAVYTFDTGAQWWKATSVTVCGPRILKPGPGGQQRLGKERHEAAWVTYGFRGVKDVQDEHSLPEWLDHLLSEMRPMGAVTPPGNA